MFIIPFIWVNCNNLTATSLESWLIRGNIPKWPYFRLVKYYNLPRFMMFPLFFWLYKSSFLARLIWGQRSSGAVPFTTMFAMSLGLEEKTLGKCWVNRGKMLSLEKYIRVNRLGIVQPSSRLWSLLYMGQFRYSPNEIQCRVSEIGHEIKTYVLYPTNEWHLARVSNIGQAAVM